MNNNNVIYSNWALKLIIINVAVFLIQSTLDPATLFMARKYLGLTPAMVIGKGYVWQIVSYMFLHVDFMHLFFNMYALLMFGIPIEQAWGSRRFLIFYFYTGIGAGLTIFVLNYFVLGGVSAHIPTIGASGAIFGILVAYGFLFPDTLILIFFVFPLKAKYLVVLYGAITLWALSSSGGGGGISHAGHLGGLVFGLAYFLYYGRFGKPLRSRAFKTKLSIETKKRTAVREEQERGRKDILLGILQKLREDGPNSLSDDEFQQVRYMQIMHEKETNELCVEDDFNAEDPYCRKCNHLEACILREMKKFIQ